MLDGEEDAGAGEDEGERSEDDTWGGFLARAGGKKVRDAGGGAQQGVVRLTHGLKRARATI